MSPEQAAEFTRLTEEKLERDNDIRTFVQIIVSVMTKLGIPISVFSGGADFATIIPPLISKFMTPGAMDFSEIDMNQLTVLLQKYSPLVEDLIPKTDE